MKISFNIYLATKSKWVLLSKIIDMPVVPRIGEHIKFKNDAIGDYFGFKVIEVTYRETSQIEVMTDLLNNLEGRMYSFDDDEEEEFEEYYLSYLREGWTSNRGVGQNNRYKGA